MIANVENLIHSLEQKIFDAINNIINLGVVNFWKIGNDKIVSESLIEFL